MNGDRNPLQESRICGELEVEAGVQVDSIARQNPSHKSLARHQRYTGLLVLLSPSGSLPRCCSVFGTHCGATRRYGLDEVFGSVTSCDTIVRGAIRKRLTESVRQMRCLGAARRFQMVNGRFGCLATPAQLTKSETVIAERDWRRRCIL